METTLELRSIPLWLLCNYLHELGGQPGDEDWLEEAGWQVRLTRLEDYRIGSLQVGQVRLEWRADELAQAHTWPLLEKKLLRAGG
jgi:hypothetical protein